MQDLCGRYGSVEGFEDGQRRDISRAIRLNIYELKSPIERTISAAPLNVIARPWRSTKPAIRPNRS